MSQGQPWPSALTNWIIHTKLHIYGFSGKGRGRKETGKEEGSQNIPLWQSFLQKGHMFACTPLAHLTPLCSLPRCYRLSEFVTSAPHYTPGFLFYNPLPPPSKRGSSHSPATVLAPSTERHQSPALLSWWIPSGDQAGQILFFFAG